MQQREPLKASQGGVAVRQGLRHLVLIHLFIHPSRLIFNNSHHVLAQSVKNLPAMQETWVRSLSWEDPLEKEMAAHSSILAWRIPGQRSLAGYSPRGHTESDTTEKLTFSPYVGLHVSPGEYPGCHTSLGIPP